MERTYICIDLKSFYASVECVERGLDPLTTNLVVADETRTEKTICLAISPSLKSFGLPGRARLFEVIQKVKEINIERRKKAPYRRFTKKSTFQPDLQQHPEYELDFIIAPPQMAHYIDISTKVYDVYLKYVAIEDIHVYSIDEVFIDATNYLKTNKKTPYEFAMMIITDILKTTKITATAGIGTNLFLTKVALDIVAKHVEPSKDGVRIASLDEQTYRTTLWNHRPLTDFWRIGKGYSERLNRLGLYTMGDIAKCSVGTPKDYYNEDLLYKEFGINAELLIDHAWGYEPTTINDIKKYRPQTNSLSTGQVLSTGYKYEKALLIVKEMVDLLSLDLVNKELVTNNMSLSIGYDIENLKNQELASSYKGEISEDYLGRKIPKASHKSTTFKYTSSSKQLIQEAINLYTTITNPDLLVRRINIGFNNVIREEEWNNKTKYQQLTIFDNLDKIVEEENIQEEEQKKEKELQKAVLKIKEKFGKNAILKGMNFEDGATAKERNNQIGGHKS